MPNLNDGLEAFELQTNNFGFSGERIDGLDATEYTLVTLVVDTSGSTHHLRPEIRAAVSKVVESCAKSPRKDNLMIRVCEFGTNFSEIHGFKKLNTIGKDDYASAFTGSGMTALCDAAENAVAATTAYGQTLTTNGYQVNGIVFLLTDGGENASKATESSVNDALKAAVKSEALESLITILIGINLDSGTDTVLDTFKKKVGITQYLNIGEATPGKLAKLADFVSKSISSQSQSLGSGGPSKTLTF